MSRSKRDSADFTPTAGAPADEQPVSKSERKRQAHRLQALGRQLTELKPADLEALDLPDRLVNAITDYQRFPSHEAKRRQLQFIGRVMRDVDVEPIAHALDTLHGQSAEAQYEFHQIERWRERLLEQGDALTEFLSEHPGTDAQQLRHHIHQVHKARSDEKRRSAYRALFRFLRDAIHPV